MPKSLEQRLISISFPKFGKTITKFLASLIGYGDFSILEDYARLVSSIFLF